MRNNRSCGNKYIITDSHPRHNKRIITEIDIIPDLYLPKNIKLGRNMTNSLPPPHV